MKWLFKIIGLILVVALVGTVGLVIYVGVSVIDNTNNTITSVKDNNYSTDYLLSRELCLALDETKTNNEVSFILDELDMNEMLYSFVAPLNEVANVFSGAYFEYRDDKKLHLELNVDVGVVQTRLQGTLSIEIKDKNIVFSLNDASIGSLEILNNFIAKSIINSLTIEESLNELDITCKIDKENLSISFSEDDINNLLKLSLKDDGNFYLYSLIVHLALNNEGLINFFFGEDEKIGFILHTDNLVNSDSQRNGTIEYSLDELENADNKTLIQLDEGVATLQNISSIMNYYVLGYDALNEFDKVNIDETSLAKDEKGIKTVNTLTMVDAVLNKEPQKDDILNLLDPRFNITLDEHVFNQVFASMNIIGTSFAFTDQEKISYITIESLTADIIENNLILHLCINFNGKRVYLNFDFDLVSGESLKMNLKVNSLEFGNYVLDDKAAELLLKYLDFVMSDETWFNVTENGLLLDFNEIISSGNEGFKTILDKMKHNEISLENGTNDNGYLEIIFSLI